LSEIINEEVTWEFHKINAPLMGKINHVFGNAICPFVYFLKLTSLNESKGDKILMRKAKKST
jgi:hypothetical protein